MNKFQQGDIIIYNDSLKDIYFFDTYFICKAEETMYEILYNYNNASPRWADKESIELNNIIYTTIFSGIRKE